jgi:hypothetical protein
MSSMRQTICIPSAIPSRFFALAPGIFLQAAVLFLYQAGVQGQDVPEQRTAEELRAVPTSVQWNDRKLELFVSLRSDAKIPNLTSFRLDSEDPKLLEAEITLKEAAGKTPLRGLSVLNVWLVKKDKIWTSHKVEVAKRKEDDPFVKVTARGPSLWLPKMKVDVVVQFKDDAGKTHLLRARDQEIGTPAEEVNPFTYRPPETKFERAGPIVEGIHKAAKVILYEGLPHQRWESALLEQELKAKKTIELHHFPFYQELLPLKDADSNKLLQLFSALSSLRSWRSLKRCGPFHPDYCLEFQDGMERYRVLICFGCFEVKCYGPDLEFYGDVTDEVAKELATILKPYRKNRPEKKRQP